MTARTVACELLGAADADTMRNSSDSANAVAILQSHAPLHAAVGRVSHWPRLAIVACACVFASTSLVRTADAQSLYALRVDQSLATINVTQLPREGREVLALIQRGGPFASPRDGNVFGNRERILPRRPRGYYEEFTVRTPGERTRGARRIIAGRGDTGDVRNSGEYYYTDDHYQSFRRIVQ